MRDELDESILAINPKKLGLVGVGPRLGADPGGSRVVWTTLRIPYWMKMAESAFPIPIQGI
jgi:hypothetical protein